MKEFLINENDSGQRIDKFITKLMPKLPKTMLYKGMRKNCVKLNGKHIKDGSVFINNGDRLQLYFKDEFFETEKKFILIESRLDIVYEDKNILVINKEVGTVVHSEEKKTQNTLVNMVQSYLYEKGEYNPEEELSFKPALCNRLDRNTGGLIIAAKNAKALREMNERIRNREVRKFYMAVLEGCPEPEGHLEGYVTRKEKVSSISENTTDGAKAVSLDYRIIKGSSRYSLAEIELYTGRTHQIRAQFADYGYPLAGDTKYGGHGDRFRQSLWSIRLIFDFKDNKGVLSYLKGKKIEIKAPFLKEFM